MLHVYTEICLRRAHVSNLWAHPHMNESRHMYGWVTVHKHRHMPQMSPRLKTYHICMYLPWLIHVCAPWHKNSLVKKKKLIGQHITSLYARVVAHIWMSYTTITILARGANASRRAHMNESCHIYVHRNFFGRAHISTYTRGANASRRAHSWADLLGSCQTAGTHVKDITNLCTQIFIYL